MKRPTPLSAAGGHVGARAAKPAVATTRQGPAAQADAKRAVRSAQSRTASSDGRRVDVRGWLGGLRLSGFTLIMLGLVILAVCVLVPTVSTYVGQQQQIAALEHSVQVTRSDVSALDQERSRWNDPAYITTQARERLYYVKPGDVVYLVIDDLPASRLPQQQDAVSKSVERTKTDWTSQLVASLAQAGTAQVAVVK